MVFIISDIWPFWGKCVMTHAKGLYVVTQQMMSQLFKSLWLLVFHFMFVYVSVNSGRGIAQVIRWGTVTTWTCCLGCLKTALSTVRMVTGTVVVMWPQQSVTRLLCVSDDIDMNSVASIPGMGIPEQLKAAMEQEQSSKSHPGTSWNSVRRFPEFRGKMLSIRLTIIFRIDQFVYCLD